MSLTTFLEDHERRPPQTQAELLAALFTRPRRIAIVGRARAEGRAVFDDVVRALPADTIEQVRRSAGVERITLNNGTTIRLLTRGDGLRGHSLDLIVTNYTPDPDELDLMRHVTVHRQGSIRHIDGTPLAT